MKTIYLNGQTQHTEYDTVLALLEAFELTLGRFAVEVDGVLVPKASLAQVTLHDGAR